MNLKNRNSYFYFTIAKCHFIDPQIMQKKNRTHYFLKRYRL